MRHIRSSLGVLAVGVSLSTTLFITLWNFEIKDAQGDFSSVAQERLDALETNVTLTVNNLVSLGGLFDASHEVERQQFDHFTAPLLARNQAIQALEWIPRVPRQGRRHYEQAARRDGFPSFQFTERRSPTLLVPAGERDEYFPVFFVAPFKGNEKAMGFDLASDLVRKAALQESADSGRLVATSRIKLVQETADQYGFLVYRPIYEKAVEPASEAQRRKSLVGFALAVFRVGDIVEKVGATPSLVSGLNLAIFDCDAKTGERLLYPKGAHLDSVQDLPEGFRLTQTISVAGRTWELAAYPRPNSFRPVQWSSWAAFLTGLLLTAMLAAYLAIRKVSQETLEASEQRYRSLVHNIPDVIWTADANGAFSYISPNIEKLSGFTLDEIHAQGARLFLDCVHPNDLLKVRQGFEALFTQGQAYDVECRVRRKNGEWIWVRDRALTTYARNGVLYADGILSNITRRKQVEESLRVQSETARALAESETLKSAAPAILQSLCQVLGWDCGVLWEVDRKANLLRCVKSWHSTVPDLAELEEVERRLTFSPGDGIVGSVWQSGQPVWIPDITPLGGPVKIAVGMGLRTVVAFPIVSGGVVMSVMELLSRQVEPDGSVGHLVDMMLVGPDGRLVREYNGEVVKAQDIVDDVRKALNEGSAA